MFFFGLCEDQIPPWILFRENTSSCVSLRFSKCKRTHVHWKTVKYPCGRVGDGQDLLPRAIFIVNFMKELFLFLPASLVADTSKTSRVEKGKDGKQKRDRCLENAGICCAGAKCGGRCPV